jgi:ParB family transcriptional regulator, chromosome partitioning protein
VSAKPRGSGRGLDALLPRSEAGRKQVALGALRVSPLQPRRSFDEESLAELAASIAEKGVLQPLLVRPCRDGYEIVAGERRFRAAQRAGLDRVPVVVRSLSDQETLEIAIVENLQREDLNADRGGAGVQAVDGVRADAGGRRTGGRQEPTGRGEHAAAC